MEDTMMRILVQMAIAALDCHPGPNPLDDTEMRYVDPSPGSLDLVPPGKPDSRPLPRSGVGRGLRPRRLHRS